MCGHSNVHFHPWIYFKCNIGARAVRASHQDSSIWAGHCGVTPNPISYLIGFFNSCHILLWKVYNWFLNKVKFEGGFQGIYYQLLGYLGLPKNKNHCCSCDHLLPDRKYIQTLDQAQTPKSSRFMVFNTWTQLFCWLPRPHCLC